MDSKSSGLGGTNVYNHIFCNDLSGAFKDNQSFEKVILPESLPNVGKMIFEKANALKEVVLPSNITTIGGSAFGYCEVLENVVLPSNLKTIEGGAFCNTAIKEVILPPTVKEIGDCAFQASKIISINLDNVKSIGERAFEGAKNITGDINISKLDTIKAGTFSKTNISDVILSSSLKVIEDDAFSRVPFKSITLPEGLERIGSDAFYECKNLDEINIPNSVIQIGHRAFEGTPWIKNIGSENGVYYIANVAYEYDSSYKPDSDTFALREGTVAISDGFGFPTEVKEKVKSLQLPESLREIGNNVFQGFKVLGEVKLPSSLKRIGQYAFAYCPKFWCNLPENLEQLEYQAFYNCTTLSQATLPESLHYIGGEVFRQTAVGTLYINSKDLHYHFLDWEMGSPSSICDSSVKKIVIGSQVTRLFDRMFFEIQPSVKIEFEDPENSRLAYVGDACFGYGRWRGIGGVINNFPHNLVHIGDDAFGGFEINSKLILDKVKYLGSSAFGGTKGFESVMLPETVDTIGEGVFEKCKDIRHVEFNVRKFISISSSSSIKNSQNLFANCDSLKTVVIGFKVTNLPRSMFNGCENLENVTFADAETRSTSVGSVPLTIHDYAFTDCRKLTSLKLPERVDSIGREFISFTKLTTISIPASCKYLGKYALSTWKPLESIYFHSEIPPVFDGPLTDLEWAGAQLITIYVPEESYELYRNEADLWKYNLEALPDAAVDDLVVPDSNVRITSAYDINGNNAIEKWNNGAKGVYILKLSNGSTRKVVR